MPAGTRSGTRPGTPDRAVPIVGVPGLPRCRPSSTVERRVNASGRGNCYRRLFLVTGKSWRRPPCLRRLRGIVKPRLQWLKGNEREWERGKREWGGKSREKTFLFSGFSSRQHQVGDRKRWQCSVLVDEWHLCRLSILLLLLLELSKMSKLCLSILQILAWPATRQHYQT